jgi:hypothetical protein
MAQLFFTVMVYDNPGDMLADISYFTKSNKSDFG